MDDATAWAHAEQVSNALIDTLGRLQMPDIVVTYGAAGIVLRQLRSLGKSDPKLAKHIIEGLCYELATLID